MIGDFVKRDIVKEEIFERTDRWTHYLKKKNRFGKDKMFWLVWRKLYDCYDHEIDEYIKTRDLEQYK
jgi:hypothetical protein